MRPPDALQRANQGVLLEFKVYDDTRRPPEWTALVGPTQCAVFLKDVKTANPLALRASVAISHASIVAPFLLGAALALWLYPRFAEAGILFTPFALFIGIAMSVTAFPVVARMLTDTKMQKSSLSVLALACAAVDDVTAWCLLALVVSVTRAEPEQALVTVGAAIAFHGLGAEVQRGWRDSESVQGKRPEECSQRFVLRYLSAR